jgi:hypothetical protein
MTTWRLLNPDARQIETAVAEAVRRANQGGRTRTVAPPAGLAGRVLGSAEGVYQADGGGGPNHPDSRAETSSLFAAWWTAKGGDKFVLVDGRRVDAEPSTPESPRGVPEVRAKPAEAIRGWRRLKSGEVHGAYPAPLADLGRMPAADDTREALTLAALYGDAAAAEALRDYDAERGKAEAR